jgi:hypothetical protein
MGGSTGDLGSGFPPMMGVTGFTCQTITVPIGPIDVWQNACKPMRQNNAVNNNLFIALILKNKIMFAKLRIINKNAMKKIGQKWTKLQHTDYQIVVLHI